MTVLPKPIIVQDDILTYTKYSAKPVVEPAAEPQNHRKEKGLLMDHDLEARGKGGGVGGEGQWEQWEVEPEGKKKTTKNFANMEGSFKATRFRSFQMHRDFNL